VVLVALVEVVVLVWRDVVVVGGGRGAELVDVVGAGVLLVVVLLC